MLTAVEHVLAGLRDLTGLPASTRVPPKPPPVFIRVEPSAPEAYSPAYDKVFMIVEVYGRWQDMETVLEMIYQCRDYLRFTIPTDYPAIVGWDEMSGPHELNDPDIEETHTRWQLAGHAYQALT